MLLVGAARAQGARDVEGGRGLGDGGLGRCMEGHVCHRFLCTETWQKAAWTSRSRLSAVWRYAWPRLWLIAREQSGVLYLQ